MLLTPAHRSRLAIGTASLAILALAGCAPLPWQRPVATPVQPWGNETRPVVMIEFELDGVQHAVTGYPDMPMCSDDYVTVTTPAPKRESNLVFAFEGDGRTSASMQVVGEEFAVGFSGDGIVTGAEQPDGGRVFSGVLLDGTAFVHERPPGSPERFDEYEPRDNVPVDATASFRVICPPPPGP